MARDRKPSEKQVAVWLYEVVAPLLNGLNEERYFVGKLGTPTWRWTSRKCRFVHSIADHIDRSQLPNLAQFLRYYPKVEKRTSAHDEALVELEVAATQTFENLGALDGLRSLADRIELEFPGWRGAAGAEDGVRLLAEDVVNFEPGSDLVDRTDAAAWRKYGQDAASFRGDPRVAPHYKRMRTAFETLRSEVEHLHAVLSKLRDTLADGYRLPAAPTTSMGLASPEHF
jgi:hypothetical protein